MNARLKQFEGIGSQGTDYLNKAAQGSLGTDFEGSGILRAFSEPDRPADSDDLMSEALAEDLAKELPTDDGSFRDGAEASWWEAEQARARQRYHEERAKAAQDATPVTDRGIFERSIAARRAEKARQQAIAAAAMAKARQLTASIRSLEDALDSLLASEA